MVFLNIRDFILSDDFEAVSVLIGLIANIAVLVLTAFTLYITAFAKRLKYVSVVTNYNIFFGESISIGLMNRSLHAIPIQELFLMKCVGDMFYKVKIFSSDDPIVVESWNIKKVNTKPFTGIENWNDDGERISTSDLFEDYVIGADVGGKKILWIKPYKKAPLRKSRKSYKTGNYQILNMISTKYEEKVLSYNVNCVIHIREKDLNGQYHLHTIFGMFNKHKGGSLMLSDTIMGYNAIEGCGKNAESIRGALKNLLGIKKEDITVEMIKFGI